MMLRPLIHNRYYVSPFGASRPPPLLLLAGPVWAALLLSTPQLYLSRPKVPLRRRPILLPVGRLGRPPQVPLWGDFPVLNPRRPPFHQLPDGGAAQPVRLNADLWQWCPSVGDVMPMSAAFRFLCPSLRVILCAACVRARPLPCVLIWIRYFTQWFSPVLPG